MKKTLSITVYNESGVLTRISTVFSSRGFNIESIAVGPTENLGISKIIIVLPGDDQTIEQITKQLNKLIQNPEVFAGLAVEQAISVKEMVSVQIKGVISKVELTELR